jgi:hypothetical protein
MFVDSLHALNVIVLFIKGAVSLAYPIQLLVFGGFKNPTTDISPFIRGEIYNVILTNFYDHEPTYFQMHCFLAVDGALCIAFAYLCMSLGSHHHGQWYKRVLKW